MAAIELPDFRTMLAELFVRQLQALAQHLDLHLGLSGPANCEKRWVCA